MSDMLHFGFSSNISFRDHCRYNLKCLDITITRDKYRVLDPNNTILTNNAPPEWVLLLLNNLSSLATNLLIVTFNKGVYIIHKWVH